MSESSQPLPSEEEGAPKSEAPFSAEAKASISPSGPLPEGPSLAPAASESIGQDVMWRLMGWLAAALILRLFLLRFPAMFTLDVNTFRAWADTLFKEGPHHFYDKTWSDYPPLFMYGLWAWNWLQYLWTHNSVMEVGWAKLPACLFDIANAYLIFQLLKGRVALRSAYRAAIFYAFNPVVIFVSAVWGQVDAVITFMMLITVGLVLANRLNLVAVTAAASVMVKPQGVFMLPFAFSALWFRNPLKTWPLAIFLGLATAWAIVIPASWTKLGGWTPTLLGFSLPSVLAQPFYWFSSLMEKTGNNYPHSTVNAFNIWMLPPPNESWKPDDRIIWFLTHQQWGLVLTVSCLALVAWYLWKNRFQASAFPIFLGASVTLVGFYMLATRMHERYIFPALAFLVLAQACNQRVRWLYWAFTATSFVSITYIFFFYNDQSTWVEGLKSWMQNGMMLRSLKLSGAVVLSLLNVWLFGELISFLFVKGEDVPKVAEAPFVRFWRSLKSTVTVQAWTLKDALAPALIVLAFGALAFWRLGWPNEQIFDEVYHARTAMEYVAGISPYEWTHPPLAKLIQALGILGLHGEFDLAAKAWTQPQAFAWRFMSVIFGGLTLVGTYLLARLMFQNRGIATLATGFLALDGVFFVQSRVAMTNIYEVAFIMLSAIGTFLYVRDDRSKWLLLTGFGLGCALATRWSTLFAWGLTGLILLHHLWFTARPKWKAAAAGLAPGALEASELLPEPTAEGMAAAEALVAAEAVDAEAASQATKPATSGAQQAMAAIEGGVASGKGFVAELIAMPKKPLLVWLGWLALSMGAIPVAIYLLTYIPYILQAPGHWTQAIFSWNHVNHGWGRVIAWQSEMWGYHAHLNATHPYSSPWWSWPLMLRPTWYYFHDFKEAGPGGILGVAGVWAIGNAFIWWSSIPALGYAAYLAWRDRIKALGVLATLGIGLWVMWGVQPRPLLYMHYMFETIPFACIALAYIAHQLWFGEAEKAPEGAPISGLIPASVPIRTAQRALVMVFLGLVVFWFVWYYPLLTGWAIPQNFYQWHVWFGRAWI